MCHAQRQFAGSQRILNSCHLCLPGQRKFNFRLNLRCPVHGVALQCLQKRAVTVGRIVEIRDGLVQLRRREIRQKLLECAEAHGALIKVLVRLGKLEANRIFHKVIRAPIGILRMQIACAVMRFYKRQDARGSSVFVRRNSVTAVIFSISPATSRNVLLLIFCRI